jgi:hypothetical protein
MMKNTNNAPLLPPRNRRHRHPRGSAIVLVIIISVIVSALIAAMCWVAAEQTQRTAGLRKMDQAFFAAEAGAQRVQWYCKNNQMASISPPLTGSLNGYNYSVSWSTVSGNTILVSSIGNSGTVSSTLSFQVTPPFLPQPAIQSMGAFDNKNIVVTGDVIAGTDYSNGGSGSLSGNLTYYGSASNTGNVTGTVTHASGTPPTIDFPAIIASLQATAGQTLSGNQNNRTFDFTAIPGTKKVIYVNGNVTNPSFIGSGTLVVSGNISGAGGFGSPGNPVHLVASGNINTDNNTTMYGSIYSGGDWDRGKFNLTGLVYTSGIIKSNNGKSYLTQDATPWFDPRATGGGAGGGTTVVSAFSGPMP